ASAALCDVAISACARPGDRRQARRAARAAVAPVPLPGDRLRPAGRLRRGVAAVVRAVGFAARRGAAEGGGGWRAFHARAGGPAGGAHGRRPARLVEAARVLAAVAEGRSVPRPLQRPEAVPRVRRSGRLGPADLARSLPGAGRLERAIRFPRAAALRQRVSERAAGEDLWGASPSRRAIPAGPPGPDRPGGLADAPARGG